MDALVEEIRSTAGASGQQLLAEGESSVAREIVDTRAAVIGNIPLVEQGLVGGAWRDWVWVVRCGEVRISNTSEIRGIQSVRCQSTSSEDDKN
mgnify:CR=1 FL=1